MSTYGSEEGMPVQKDQGSRGGVEEDDEAANGAAGTAVGAN